MEKKVRFLLVEDSEDDEALILHELHRAGYQTEHLRVQDLNTVRSHNGSHWDLIISDYFLPGFSGSDVLKAVRSLPTPPPVIILSGRSGESLAVEMIQAGASDYVLKDNLGRLPLAVERGLREAQARQAKLRAEAQVARLNRVYQILSSINKAIFRTVNPQTLLQEVCGIATRFGQYSFVRIVQSRETLLVTAASSRSAQLERGQDPPLDVEKRALKQQAAIIENDLDPVPEMVLGPFHSCGIFPLRVMDEWWGCLSFFSLGKHVFTPEEVTLLRGLSHDLSWALESRAQEQRRDETQQFLEDMTSLLPGLFFKLKLTPAKTWEFLYLSPGIDLFLPYTPKQVLSDAGLMLNAIHPDDARRYREAQDKSARDLTVFSLEFRLVRPNGTVVWNLATSFPQKLSDDSIVWTGLAIDVTPQHRLQEALQREQELLAVTLENIGDGVIVVGEEGDVVLLNRTAQGLLGWTARDVVGTHWSQLDIRLPWETSAALTPWLVTLPDGKELHLETHVSDLLETSGKTRGRVMLLRDVTQREKIEERLRQSEKLESIGLLAGGIAHDFNNLLTGVFGFLQLAKMNTESPELVTQYLDSALGPFERARTLTQQLLTFAKGGQPARKPYQVVDSLRGTLHFVLGGTEVQWTLDAPDDLWPITANEGQIGQVFENLVLNARQALDGKGHVKVTLQNRDDWGQPDLELPRGRYIEIEVSDDGPGIPQALQPRIFDPFFTTKKTGTGLGLSICFSVVKKHNGALEVDSGPGKGTTFRVYLPATPT